MRHLAGDGELLASVDKDGEVQVEGTYVGRLDGFRFVPDAADGEAMRTLVTAANRVLRSEVAARARRLAGDGDEAFAIDPHGELLWQGGPVGRLAAGERCSRRGSRCGPAIFSKARRASGCASACSFCQRRDRAPAGAAVCSTGIAAGRAGARHRVPACRRARLLPGRGGRGGSQSLDKASRRALARLGVRFGTETIYVEPLLGAEAVRFRALLWAVAHGRTAAELPGGRRPGKAIAIDPTCRSSFYAAIGRRVIDGLALRPDRLERLAAAARNRARAGPFAADAELAALAGVAPGDLRGVLLALGYRAVIEGDRILCRPSRAGARRGRKRGRAAAPRTDHPFAKLKELKFA